MVTFYYDLIYLFINYIASFSVKGNLQLIKILKLILCHICFNVQHEPELMRIWQISTDKYKS